MSRAAIGVLLVIGVLIISLHQPPAASRGTDMTRIPRVARRWPCSVGALVFLFPFYYMLIGSLQAEPDTSVAGRVPDRRADPATTTARSTSAINLGRSLVNSGIFTGGVILGTVVFGVLAGYALARLQFRGRGTVFAVDAAGAGHPVPAADDPALRDDRAQLRPGRLATSA